MALCPRLPKNFANIYLQFIPTHIHLPLQNTWICAHKHFLMKNHFLFVLSGESSSSSS